MLEQDLVTKAKDLAAANFKEKMNCAESVFSALRGVGLIDCPAETVALATGFGGGIGLTGYACGALLGAVLAVSSVYGRKNPLEGSTGEERLQKLYGKPGIYRLFNSMPQQFQARMGAVNCRELCAPYEWQSKERNLNCRKAVETAVEIAVEHILAGRTDGLMRTFGPNVAGAE
ncbi:hypothetical protein BR63_01265 [Thermanaerosceptrum fracticalcis]|uniref:C_GCAxxG_C_C family protein n=1 Tax=Thermanaerosceptrum fracticalcis TaxID=1712410 RepID=A0A7G6DZ17_THEFR|nr:C-GCAxxG-C-C family (seleno)protein [Thermanaerosceptrum fracticalcis]QNB45071.1 hypothetical protein BR63_01265 [Thermanaerosceptrum fracticalcis]